MKKLFFLLFLLFIVRFPVFAGGLEAPEHIVMQTAKCDTNTTENYVLLSWDKVISAISYDIYGKPVSGSGDYILYGNTTTPQYGAFVKKNVDYYFIVVAKAEGYISPKSKEYLVNTPTVELSCRTAKENKPWYEMKITSKINNSYQLEDWFYTNFDLTYFQPEKKYDENSFLFRAFLYPSNDSTTRYFESIIKGYGEKRVVYHLNNIPTGYYRLRIILDQTMTDMYGNNNSPFVDSNEIYIYGQKPTTTPTIVITQPSIKYSEQLLNRIKAAYGSTCRDSRYDVVVDINQDRQVNGADFSLFVSNLRTAGEKWCQEQLNKRIIDSCKFPSPTLTPTPKYFGGLMPGAEVLVDAYDTAKIATPYNNQGMIKLIYSTTDAKPVTLQRNVYDGKGKLVTSSKFIVPGSTQLKTVTLGSIPYKGFFGKGSNLVRIKNLGLTKIDFAYIFVYGAFGGEMAEIGTVN